MAQQHGRRAIDFAAATCEKHPPFEYRTISGAPAA
jgi:hypothetical protein